MTNPTDVQDRRRYRDRLVDALASVARDPEVMARPYASHHLNVARANLRIDMPIHLIESSLEYLGVEVV